MNLEVSYREGVQLEESVVDHFDQLGIQGVVHHEDLDVGLVLMLGTDPVPEVYSHQIGNSAEGVLNHLDPPLRNKVVSHEGVLEVPALDNLPVGHIDKNKLVEVDLPHDEGSAVRHHVGPSVSQNFIDVVAVQNFTTLQLHLVFNSYASGVIALADYQITVGILGDQSDEPAIGLQLHGLEIVRGRELGLQNRVFVGDADVRFVVSLKEEVIA